MSESSTEKGIAHLTISKVFFLITGYCIIFALTRILGPEGFGIYSTISAFIVILNTVLLFGTIQSVSKFVSEDETKADLIKFKALQLQVFIGIIITSIYYFLAPFISTFLKDSTLIPLLQLSSIIVLCYCFYGVYIGYINGKKQFSKQAFIEITFTVLKALLTISLAYVGYKYSHQILTQYHYSFNIAVYGSLLGFCLAIILILIISIISIKSKPYAKEGFSIKKLITFQVGIVIFTLIITLLLQTDLILVKKFTNDFSTGIYAAALQISRVPYQIITGLIFIIFPLISEATFKKDTEKVKSYIHKTLHYTFIIVNLLVILFASTSKGTILLLYTEKYIQSASILSIYMFNILFFCLMLIMTTIISGSGKPYLSCSIAFTTLLLSIVLNYYSIPIYGINGAAIATTIAMFAGMLLATGVIILKFKCFLSPISLLKICLISCIIYFISLMIPTSTSLFVIIKFIVLSMAYFRLLFLLKEITSEDIKRIKMIIN